MSTSFPCQGSVLLMHVRQFESAQLWCLDSLYPPLSMRKGCIQGLFVELRLVTRSGSDRDFLYSYKRLQLLLTYFHRVSKMPFAPGGFANVSELHIPNLRVSFPSTKLCFCSFMFHFIQWKLFDTQCFLGFFMFFCFSKS